MFGREKNGSLDEIEVVGVEGKKGNGEGRAPP